MKALVQTNNIDEDYLGNIGKRIVQVEADEDVFEVHPDLIWVDCPDNCKVGTWYYLNNQVVEKPEKPIE